MPPHIFSLVNAGAAVLLLGGAPTWATAAPACSEAGKPVFQDIPLALDGQGRLKRTIDLPAGTGVLLTASESGVDVRIEVQSGPGSPAVSSDNPVRRWGPQRVLLPSGPTRPLSIQVIAKEGVRGRVRLQASAFPAA